MLYHVIIVVRVLVIIRTIYFNFGKKKKKTMPPNCFFEIGDVTKLPLPYKDNEFDYVSMRYFLQILSEESWSKVLRDLVRITKEGGWVLDYFWRRSWLHGLFFVASCVRHILIVLICAPSYIQLFEADYEFMNMGPDTTELIKGIFFFFWKFIFLAKQKLTLAYDTSH